MEEITCGNGKEGECKKKETTGNVCAEPEQKTLFHTGARSHMSARLTWISRQVVHLYNFYKGDPIEMSTEQRVWEEPEPLHHHLHPQTLAAAIPISTTTIVLSHLVRTCNHA